MGDDRNGFCKLISISDRKLFLQNISFLVGIDDKAVTFATGPNSKKVPLDEVKEKSKTPSLNLFGNESNYNISM